MEQKTLDKLFAVVFVGTVLFSVFTLLLVSSYNSTGIELAELEELERHDSKIETLENAISSENWELGESVKGSWSFQSVLPELDSYVYYHRTDKWYQGATGTEHVYTYHYPPDDIISQYGDFTGLSADDESGIEYHANETAAVVSDPDYPVEHEHYYYFTFTGIHRDNVSITLQVDGMAYSNLTEFHNMAKMYYYNYNTASYEFTDFEEEYNVANATWSELTVNASLGEEHRNNGEVKVRVENILMSDSDYENYTSFTGSKSRIDKLIVNSVEEDVIEHIRTEHLQTGDSTYLIRAEFSAPEPGCSFTLIYSTDWSFAGVNPEATCSASSGSITFSYLRAFVYEAKFTCNSSNYLAIKDISNSYYTPGFESGLPDFWQERAASNDYETENLNSTIVAAGALSYYLADTGVTYHDYLFEIDNGEAYLSAWFYITTAPTTSLEIEYYNGSSWVVAATVDKTITDRWQFVTAFLHPKGTTAVGSITCNLKLDMYGAGAFFVDELRFWGSSLEVYTNSAGTNTLKPTLINWNGYSNLPSSYTAINVTYGTRADNTTIQSWNKTTDANGQVTITATDTLTSAEHFVRVYAYDDTFSGDDGSTKSYFTPMTASHVDYFGVDGDAVDFSESDAEGFSYYASVDDMGVTSGYIYESPSNDAQPYLTFQLSSLTIDLTYYTQLEIRAKHNSNTTRSILLYIEGDYDGSFYQDFSDANTWETFTWDLTGKTLSNEWLRIYLDDAGAHSGSLYDGDYLYVDTVRLVHVDTPNLREYDSYFYLSSENDSLGYKIYQDTYFYGIVSDTTVFQKNNTVGTHNLTYVVFQDNDDTTKVYLPSSSYSYSYTVSTAFKIEDDFLEIGDWAAHYTIETNMDRDSVSIYLMLNGSYVQFPDGTYSTSPGSIIFSRPSYGYYNFTRIAEYDSTNYTRQTWITVTSSARMTTFMVSGTDSSSDYVVVSWNTNKGTGTLYAYDNSSLIATDTSEGSVVITKSSTVGLHNLSFDVVVESRNFTFVADYTVSDWTVSVALSIYSSSSYYVSIDESHTVTVTVTRSDSSDFDGYVFVNGTTVGISSGSGSFTVSSSDVTRETYSVTHVQDLTATNRTFAANDLAVTFDKLVGYLSVVNVGQSSAICVVTFNNSYDDVIVDNYEYAVYVNDQYYSTYTENTFSIIDLTPGTYNVELRNIRNRDNEVDTGSSTEVSFEVTGPAKAKNDWLAIIILIILLLLVAIGAPAAGAWLYRRWKRSKSWLYGQDAIDKQNKRLNF